MSRQVSELETILQQMLLEHQKLLKQVDAHAAAMKAFNLKAMDAAGNQQEALRLRIAALENKRQGVIAQLARLHKVTTPMTLSDVARLYPKESVALMKTRDELKALMAQLKLRLHVTGKVAGAVLGHLNTVVRILAGAVAGAGLYTKHGVPKVAPRIGAMNTVG
jgi:hypothetical protein